MLMKKRISDINQLNRRRFLKASAAVLGSAGVANIAKVSADTPEPPWPPPSHSLIAKNDVILFQGEAVTDFGRKRESAATPNLQPGLGMGYAWLAAVGALVERPDYGLRIFNRGVSGDKVYQLADRWQADCLDLKPNLLSILIGVNDFWHTLTGKYDGTVEIYERDYRALLERTLKALPEVKLVICEPFVLRFGQVNARWFPEFDAYRAAALRVADAYHATFIPFQAMFDEAVNYAPPEFWSHDGLHPTQYAMALLAHNWLRVVDGKR